MFKLENCPNVGSVQKACRNKFSLLKEDSKNYKSGWKLPENITEVVVEEGDDENDDPLVVAWEYQTWKELRGVPFVGNLGLYPGGGYSAELGVNYDVSFKKKLNFYFR